MLCPHCQTSNPEDASRCRHCQAPLAVPARATSQADIPTGIDWVAEDWSVPAGRPGEAPGEIAGLRPGRILAGRYEIRQLLGAGGMGAVYKVHDRELDRPVALKVIRPELAADARILRRFKQELILARQITHKNVIRIYDLGQADGMKFITMDFIEGEPVSALLRRQGKLSPEAAADLLMPVCLALEAAHAEQVVHRDLKPPNIMVATDGKIVVMDFGIAHSIQFSGLTETGALVGTPVYMSPEQVGGSPLDGRSDLYTLGVIFYELLTGRPPFAGGNITEVLLRRGTEKPVPPSQVDPAIPGPVSDIVLKCLQPDPTQRYQTAREVLQDLEAWRGPLPGAVVVRRPQPVPGFWKLAALGLALAVVGLAVFLFRQRPPPSKRAVTLLVADIDNRTGDAVFDGSLEPMFTLAMEGAAFINSYPRAQARRIAGQLRPGATRLDEPVARLVAVREGIDVVVAGAIQRRDSGYALSIHAIEGRDGKPLIQRERVVSSKEAVLAAVGKLAAPVRRALGDTTPESAQLAKAETFTAASIEAAHAYGVAQDLQLAGKWEDAIRAYSRVLELDSSLGRACAGIAVAYRNLRQRAEAEKYYQLALSHVDRMTDREKYRTRGGYYVTVGNQAKAVEEFSALVREYPADNTGHANLALAYFLTRNFAAALEEGRLAMVIYPKNVAQRNNMAWYALYAGDFAAAEREARAVLALDAKFENAYNVLALAQLTLGQTAPATATYQQLEKMSQRGASVAAAGLADLALYEGRTADAVSILEKGLAADQARKNAADAAGKSVTLAGAYLRRGLKAEALAAADRALAAGKQIHLAFPAARVYLEAGREAKARGLAAELGARLTPDPQAYAKLIEAEIHLRRGQAQQAIPLLQDAQKLADTWLGRLALGRAYLETGQFAPVVSEFQTCLKRRGEATAVFLDDVASYRLLPPVHYYLGRAQEGLKNPTAAADSYRTFLQLRDKGEPDPEVAYARGRLAPR